MPGGKKGECICLALGLRNFALQVTWFCEGGVAGDRIGSGGKKEGLRRRRGKWDLME